MNDSREPQKGDKVFHDSRSDFVLVDMKFHRDILFAKIENENTRVTCNCEELVYSDNKNAWYLPGRVLNKEDRAEMRESGRDPLDFERSYMGERDNGRLSL